MAVLERIRQRKKILAIVIGAALIAFIIEVGIEALGRQAGNSTAAKVGSEKIDIMAFQRRVEKEAAADQNSKNQMDAAVRQQQVLNTMINETLLNQEYEKVGIEVSDHEITELMVGKNPAPMVQQFAQQVGAESPAQVNEILTNPQKFGATPDQLVEMRNEWNKLQEQLVEQLQMTKLQMLVGGALQANDLDRAQMAEDEATTCYITFVKKDFAGMDDAKYPVSDQEIKAEWEKNKAMYRLDEENRNIHYIALNIVPSQADIAAANKVADNAWAALQKGTGIDSVRILGTVQIDTVMQTLDKFTNKAVKDFVAGAGIGSTKRDTVINNKHKMYKLINKVVSLDSVNYNLVMVPGNKATQDSALAMLQGGKTPEEVAKNIKGAQMAEDRWERIYMTPDSIKSKFANAGEGYFVMNSSDQGATLLKVNEKKAPKTFYTLATISYDAYASQKTHDDARAKLQDFLNKNKTAKDFAENAAKAGFQALPATITPSTAQLGQNPYTGQGISETRKAIKWAFDSKKDQVSPIFSDNKDYLVAVSLDEIYDGDYMPWNAPELKEMLTNKVRNSKKADALMAQFKGKANDLNGYAKLMGAQVDSAQVVFASNFTPKLENEAGLAGRIAGSPKGKLVGPFKGENGVYVFQVYDIQKDARQPSKEELDNRYAQQRGGGMIANPNAMAFILGKATKVKRSLINFY
ncbi:MAG: SurA N-terminal domain-containing protein [Muribaculaceae bacterium]|nr:SurA N-terminal domain-containing protein [Muribaculaceae bacterium]